MKKLFILIALTVIGLGLQSNANAQTKMEMIKQLIGTYQNSSRQYLQSEIGFAIDPVNEINAYVEFDDRPLIVLFEGLMRAFDNDQVLAVVCHEIGHVYGEVFDEDDWFAGEGEADYFAGKCIAEYLQRFRRMSTYEAQRTAAWIGKKTMSSLYEVRTNQLRAKVQYYEGISSDYPDPDCRALSIAAGAYNQPRPSCWYNPAAIDR
jgi:hypothetical protein